MFQRRVTVQSLAGSAPPFETSSPEALGGKVTRMIRPNWSARRTVVSGLIVVLLGTLGVAAASPAPAVQSLTYSWAVPCDDGDGVYSDEALGVTLPSGTYAVTVAGACSIAALSLWNISAGTPCSTSATGPIPCVSATVGNVPSELCGTATGPVYTQQCDQWAIITSVGSCGDGTVAVNGTCLTAGTAGLVTHTGGAMHARYLDSRYDDNLGAFIVTATWTPQ